MVNTFEREIGGRSLQIETGKLAGLADGAVTVRYGDTVVLVTAMTSKPREGIDFFPLTIDYEEKLYAAGKIPGSFFRREGRPTQEATLAARLTDRPLRPLFPKAMKKDTQIVITVLSADQENPPDILGILGASAALGISSIPFDGPVTATRLGYMEGELIVNPTFQQQENSTLDLVVAGTNDAVVMVEAGASEVPEELLLQALRLGQVVNSEVNDLQSEMARSIGKPKFSLPDPELPPPGLEAALASVVGDRLESALFSSDNKGARDGALSNLEMEAVGALGGEYGSEKVSAMFQGHIKTAFRDTIVQKSLRPDGRGLSEIRPITCDVGVLPRTHGSGLFTRGQTQALTITTLGSMRQEQRLDTIGVVESKRYLHHYNFPPYSVGETGRMGNAGRREIGHGALAERALLPVIPSEEEFSYTIRVVSEIMSSNGSTSMASVCGSTLSLMDAGVPIKAPVAGVAMGLVKSSDDKFAILTDIQGMEDALGDMDFKVAGTEAGVTALQMDIKVKGITFEVMEQALEQAREARLFVLDKMNQTISVARPELSRYAPRMTRISIDKEKIGAIIGPGGKTIRAIAEDSKATIDVEDDGTILIGSVSAEGANKAIEIIEGLTKEVEVGEKYNGKVTRVMAFGAFVEILPGKEGLVHISELADHRVGRVEDVVDVGDEVMVMVTEIDRMGRINLSRRAVFEGLAAAGARIKEGREGREGQDRNRDGDRDNRDRRPSGRGDRPSGGPGGSRPPGGYDRGRGPRQDR